MVKKIETILSAMERSASNKVRCCLLNLILYRFVRKTVSMMLSTYADGPRFVGYCYPTIIAKYLILNSD
ncbi:MAG: hypothetical protein ACI4NQ_01990 [Christensenellales bacterium]